MVVTYIGLSEYFRKIVSRARKKKYIFIVSLIARQADAEELYKKVEKDWASLNDLTNKKILFVFSAAKISKNASFIHSSGEKSYVGEMCPYIELLNGQDIEDNRGEFEYMVDNFGEIDWKAKHSQSISVFAEEHNILEEQIPCLFLWDIVNDKKKVMAIYPDTEIYEVMKKIISEVNGYYNKINDINIKIQNIEKYYDLYTKMENSAKDLEFGIGQAIIQVLRGEVTYLTIKDQIADKKTRRDLKRINQWKEQFFPNCNGIESKKEYYYCLRQFKKEMELKIDQTFDEINIEESSSNKQEKGKIMYVSSAKIFLSYNWNDESVANDIYNYFKGKKGVELHRDKIHIGTWSSIRTYMQTISDMDYTILLISDAYLKSENCMYEVLEVMRERKYQDKIFPAVISTNVYRAIERVSYVKFWKEKADNLREELETLGPHEIGTLGNELKKLEDIKNNIATFLDIISDMNNPSIPDVNLRIEEVLKNKGYSFNITEDCSFMEEVDVFRNLGIKRQTIQREPTEFELNQFVENGFNLVVQLLDQMFKQYQNENAGFNVTVEKIDGRNVFYQLYKNGKIIKGLKVFLSSMFGGVKNIGLSDNISAFGSGISWNEIYNVKYENGEMKFEPSISFTNRGKLFTEREVVKDIWVGHVQNYL